MSVQEKLEFVAYLRSNIKELYNRIKRISDKQLSAKKDLQSEIIEVVYELCNENTCQHISSGSKENGGCDYKFNERCRNCDLILPKGICHRNPTTTDDSTKAKNYLCWLATECDCPRCDNI